MRNGIPGNDSVVHSRKLYSIPKAQVNCVRETEAACDAATAVLGELPEADNAPGAVEKMLRANGILRFRATNVEPFLLNG